MKNPRPICAMAVCHKDVWQAAHWLIWAGFLGWGDTPLIVMLSQRAWDTPVGHMLRQWHADSGSRSSFLIRCPDELETGYPKSASHLFIRTLEAAERFYHGRAVLWCEPDTVPLCAGWFEAIADEYENCGHAFMGERIMHAGSDGGSHLMGNSVYPANWRTLAPRIATTLEAPDVVLWGEGKGQPWDVWAAKETTADLHETRQIQQIFTCSPWTADNLNRLRPGAKLFHRCKDATLIAALARQDHPGFAAALGHGRRHFRMNGHPSRLYHLGYRIEGWNPVRRPTGWACYISPPDPLDQMVLLNLCGSKGVEAVSAEEAANLGAGSTAAA